MGTKRKSRIAISNVKCAKAFQHNKKTYFDCTLDRTPDGQIPTKEWCYLEKSPNTTKTWDYCREDMNYDKIRKKIQEIIKSLTEQTRKIKTECELVTPEETSLIGVYNSIVEVQSDLTSKVATIYKESQAAKNSLEHLNLLSNEWEEIEKKAVDYAQQIEISEENIKLMKEEARSLKEKEEKSEIKHKKYTQEQINNESEANKMLIAEWIQEKEIVYNKDCTGMLNYEEEPQGTGLLGRYYNNPTFSGNYKTRMDNEINFELTGTQPIDGINTQNFSIQWDGYIQAPYRSTFYFSIETEGGAEVFLSGKKIISHRMYSSNEESRDRANMLLKERIHAIQDPTNNNYNKKTSEGINLADGDKYILRIKYYHSVHDFMDEDIRTYIKFSWHSDEMEEEIITKKFLFAENHYPSLKVSGINPEIGVMRKLLENDLAFKDDKTFIIQDIPFEYRGNPALKLSSLYQHTSLEFFINIPIIVYLAKIEHYNRAFPADFENMNQFFSLLEVPIPNEKDKYSNVFQATSSSLMRIYKKKFEAGKVKIDLAKTGLNQKGVPLIVFFGSDPMNSSPSACGGKLIWLSEPGSESFKSCSESSKLSASWGCEAALNSDMLDQKGSIWATNNEGIGAYLKVEFTDLFEVQKVLFRDRSTPGEQNSKLLFEFSNGKSFLYEHIHSSVEEIIEFPTPERSYWVKVTIKGVYGTINNGGAFKFFGTKCSSQKVAEIGNEEKVIKPLFNNEAKKSYSLLCDESVSNSKKLFNVDKNLGNCITVNCNNSCFDNLNISIYGDNMYSKDSGICKAAVHSGVLSTVGGKVVMCFGDKSINLSAAKKNGIQSKPKLVTDLTFNFKPFLEKDLIPVEIGVKFDVKNDVLKIWEPAVITNVIQSSDSRFSLAQYRIEGKTASVNIPAIPIKSNPLVRMCGSKIKGRDCKGTKVVDVKKVNIRFGLKDYNAVGDYTLDYGRPFGFNGNPFGWSRDMRSNIKSVNTRKTLTWENFNSLSESYAEFPPSKNSKYCSNPVVVCDRVSYTIKTGYGKFNVKIFIEILDANSQVDFKVNNVVFAKNKAIPIGNRVVLDGIVDAQNENLEITTDCTDHCFYSMGRMNMIQVFPFSDKSEKDSYVPVTEGEICGGLVKRGNECENGIIDVLHCVFQKENTLGASKCTGKYIKTKIPDVYTECPEAAGMEYCVMKKYQSQVECKKYCPGKCEGSGVCLGQ